MSSWKNRPDLPDWEDIEPHTYVRVYYHNRDYEDLIQTPEAMDALRGWWVKRPASERNIFRGLSRYHTMVEIRLWGIHKVEYDLTVAVMQKSEKQGEAARRYRESLRGNEDDE